jgi:peptidoglycan/LPS O-acetylase OafA/YrhL
MSGTLNRISGQTLEPNTSLYLDFFRFSCAIYVVVAHAFLPQMTRTQLRVPFGEDAVIAFFVLSGFVIANVAETRERNIFSYGAARLARLWSVLIPALLFGPVFDSIGIYFDRSLYETWAPNGIAGHWLPQAVASATFVNEVWFTSLAPQFNAPVWSIGFEAWYYAFFAVFMFAKRGKGLWLLLALICAGPKILLLLPTWIMGVLLYRWRGRLPSFQWLGWLLFIAGPSLAILGHAIHALEYLRNIYLPILGHDFVYGSGLGMARDFLWLNLVGIAITAHLAGAFIVVGNIPQVRGRLATAIKTGAGLTYSIYLLHFPAQLMISALCHRFSGSSKVALVLVGSLAISAGLGVFLEPLKNPLRRWLLSLAGGRTVPAL